VHSLKNHNPMPSMDPTRSSGGLPNPVTAIWRAVVRNGGAAQSMRSLLEDVRDALREQTATLVTTSARLDGLESRVDGIQAASDRLNKRLNKMHRDMLRPRSLAACEPEEAFLKLLREVERHKTTGLGPERLYVLWQVAKNVRRLSGATAEIGAFRGGSAYFLASALRQLSNGHSDMYVIDTFEGHPASKLTEFDTFQPAGKFSDTSFERVREYLSVFPRVKVCRGEFSSVVSDLPDRAYRLVHVDTDLYQSTLDCLNYFGPRLEAGGMIVVDDYGAEKCEPVVDAVRDYLALDSNYEVWDPITEQFVMVRR
jgi:hypothetical protein